MRHAQPSVFVTAPLAIFSAGVWGVVEFAALCRSRWTLRRAAQCTPVRHGPA